MLYKNIVLIFAVSHLGFCAYDLFSQAFIFLFHMKDASSHEIVVKQGKRHPLELLIGGVSFSIFFYLLFLFCFRLWKNDSFDVVGSLYNLIILSGSLLATGIGFTVTKSIVIDLQKNKLVSVYSVGFFNHYKTSEIPELNYVSVFKNSKDIFEVNLWYGQNNHYKMFTFVHFDEALIFGKTIAKKLHLDLLNATQKGNSVWVEMEAE